MRQPGDMDVWVLRVSLMQYALDVVMAFAVVKVSRMVLMMCTLENRGYIRALNVVRLFYTIVSY